MAPPANSAPARKKGRLPKNGPRCRSPIVKKPRQASSAPESLQLQTKPPVSHAVQSHVVQPTHTAPALIAQPASNKRKRSQESEAEADEPKDQHPAQQPRKSTPSCSEPSKENLQKDPEAEAEAKSDEPEGPPRLPENLPLLSEEDLQSLYDEVMDSVARNSPSLKRTPSRRSIASSDADTFRSQRFAGTTAFYRRNNLAAVQISLHIEPPDHIQGHINGIINAEISKQRRAELRIIAQAFRNGCLKAVRGKPGEDDFVRPLYNALESLGLKNLCFREKAEWREELKPVVQKREYFSSSFLAGVQQPEIADASAPPPKRQQQSAGETYMSPGPSMTGTLTRPVNNSHESSIMPPPAIPVAVKAADRFTIKTPRPDLSMGTELEDLISALSSQDLNMVKATNFLDWVQNEMVQHESDRPLEPMLIPVPGPLASDLAFPFAVVEGKAYATGRQIIEAENQAAVSGACALKIQLDLDRLVDHASRTTTSSGAPPTSSDTSPPLFFSITTQGPIHELWVHWTTFEYDVRMFKSKLVESCNALLLERAEEFVVKLNNVAVWGTGPFLDSVVKRLGVVARKAEV
ncbi:MAG: hypothetical protein M1836_005086 [Candelina mexicana]|nr:MAG: hypothetical protein M1836_005086 [Candelina mexicana]